MHFPWPYTAKLCCLSAVRLNAQSHLCSLGSTLLYRLYNGLWVVGPASALALRHLICHVCCAWFGPEANTGKTAIGGLAARGCGERPSRTNETSCRHVQPPRQKKSRCVRIMSWRRRWGEGSKHTRAPPPADRACGLGYLTEIRVVGSARSSRRVWA